MTQNEIMAECAEQVRNVCGHLFGALGLDDPEELRNVIFISHLALNEIANALAKTAEGHVDVDPP